MRLRICASFDFDPTNLVDTWMMHRLNETIKGIEADFKQYRINDALKKVRIAVGRLL